MNELYKMHFEKFGVEPIVIGINFKTPLKIVDGIAKALLENKPYNEEELLSPKELEQYKKNKISF